jgi:hypothetical protein
MSQGKEHIDKLIQEKLNAAEVTPPASVWNSIESSLLAKQRRRAIVLYRWVGSVAAILLLGVLLVYFIRSEQKVEPVQNKMAQEEILDSIIANDSIFDNKAELKIKEKKQNVFAKTDIILLDAKDKRTILQDRTKKLFHAQNNILERSLQTRERISLVVLNKLNQGDLSSIYKSDFKVLSFFKANLYKKILENEETAILLAENSSSSASRREPSGWSLGLAFAPTNVGRSSGGFSRKLYADYDAVNTDMNAVSASEQDLAAYSGGLNLVYKLSERWSVQSGVYYLKQGQRIENFGVLQNDINSSMTSNSYFGNIAFDNYTLMSDNFQAADFMQLSEEVSYSSYNDNLIQRFALIEIPLLANYKIINRKTVFSITGGISPGIIVGNNVYLENYSSSPVGKTEEINTLIYKSVFGINLEYPLSRKLYFNFSPTFKLQLNNFNRNAIVSERLNYLELKTGLNYRF